MSGRDNPPIAGIAHQTCRAVVGRFYAGQQTEKGGFARPVFSDNGNVLAVIDSEISAVEKFAVPVAMGNAGKVKVVSQEVSSQSPQ